MRVIRRLFVGLALLLLVIIAVPVGLLLTPFGEKFVHGAVTSWAGKQLGRTVGIDGQINLTLGRHAELSASGVHLANADWGSRSDMLVAEHVSIGLDLDSLLSRAPTLIIDEIRVDGLDLLLERTSDGAQNWDFDRPKKQPGPSWLDHLPFVVERVSMPNAHVQFIGPRLDRPLDIRLSQVDQQRGAGDMLDITATGVANEVDLNLTGEIGPFANLISAKAFTASLDGHLGEVTLAVRARIDDLAHPVDSEVNLKLDGPSAAYVTTTLGVRNIGDGPFNLAMTVTRAPDGNGVQGNVVGKIGEFEISADSELSEPSVMGKLTLRAEISGPDVSLLAGIVGYDLFPAERFRLVAMLERTGERLQIDQATLDLPDSALSVQGSVKKLTQFAGDDLTIHVSGQKVEKFRELLRIPGIATGPFDVRAELKPSQSGEDTLQLTAKTSLVELSASGPIGTAPSFFGTRLNCTVSGQNFAPWSRVLGLTNGPSAAFTGRGNVEWIAAGVNLSSTVLNIGNDTVSLDGVIGTTSASNADLRFGLQGRSLAAAAQWVGWSNFPAQPYKINGRMQRRSGNMRLDGVDIAAANARLQLGGTLGKAPRWSNTQLTFTFTGQELRAFSALVPSVNLPAGTFRAQGGFTYNPDRISLRNVNFAAAGSTGTITAEVELPLGASVSTTQFNVQATGPNLSLLAPDVGDMDAVQQKFDLSARGSFGPDRWVFETLHFDSPGGFLSVQGLLDKAPDHSDTALNVTARTTDLRRTGHLFGVNLPAVPLNFAAAVSGTPTAFRMDRLAGHIGKSDFTGTVALDLEAKPDLNVNLSADFLDLTPIEDSVTEVGGSAVPIAADARSIPNIALPMALLDRIDAEIAIRSAKTSFFRQIYDDLRLQATLKDGRLTIDPLSFGSVNGDLSAYFSIAPTAGAPTVKLTATGEKIRLGVWPGMNETAAASLYTVTIDVTASGANLRELAATLDGEIRLVGAGGRVPSSRTDALTSDFLTELGRTLNPMAKRKPFTDVVCQAYLFEAGDGMLRTDPAIVIQTTDTDIVSNGSVNLRNETIDFNFKTAARRGLGFSAGELFNSYVKVSGTLAKPHLTVDPRGTLVYGGAAFATGGLSILATTLWDRVTRQKDPCAAAVAEADKRSTKRAF